MVDVARLRDTPAAAVATLRSAVLRALESPEVIARLQALAIRPAKSSSEAFAARVHAEVARWADTVKKAKIELQD